MTAQVISDRLQGTNEGSSFRCRCPVHGGRSLIVTEKAGTVLVNCKAGCSQEDVVEALRQLGLWEKPGDRHRPIRSKPMEAEGSLSERGITIATVAQFGLTEDTHLIRVPVKMPDGTVSGVKARRKHPRDNEARYFWLEPADCALFAHWPTVKQYAVGADGFVYMVEGVMDAIALTQAGLPAVAPVHGAGKYPTAVIEMMAKLVDDGLAMVFIFAQNDIPGLKFADGWRERLRTLWPHDDALTPYSSHVSVIVTTIDVAGVQVKDPADVLKVLGPERFRAWASARTADYFWTSPVLQPVQWSLR